MISVRIDLRDVADHHNRLTITSPTHHICRVEANKNINKVSLCWIDDQTRLGELIVATPVNVVAAIFLRTVGTQKELLVGGGTIVCWDSPLVLTGNEIWWQHGPVHIMALNGPVHHSVLLGMVRPPSRNSPGRHAAVLVEEAAPGTTVRIKCTMPRYLSEKALHKAVTTKCIGHSTTAIGHFPLQAEPAHVMSCQCTRHTDISPATFPMTVERPALR